MGDPARDASPRAALLKLLASTATVVAVGWWLQQPVSYRWAFDGRLPADSVRWDFAASSIDNALPLRLQVAATRGWMTGPKLKFGVESLSLVATDSAGISRRLPDGGEVVEPVFGADSAESSLAVTGLGRGGTQWEDSVPIVLRVEGATPEFRFTKREGTVAELIVVANPVGGILCDLDPISNASRVRTLYVGAPAIVRDFRDTISSLRSTAISGSQILTFDCWLRRRPSPEDVVTQLLARLDGVSSAQLEIASPDKLSLRLEGIEGALQIGQERREVSANAVLRFSGRISARVTADRHVRLFSDYPLEGLTLNGEPILARRYSRYAWLLGLLGLPTLIGWWRGLFARAFPDWRRATVRGPSRRRNKWNRQRRKRASAHVSTPHTADS